MVIQTESTARVDEWTAVAGPTDRLMREQEVRSVVAAPIAVDGSVWGVIATLSAEPLPGDTEARLADFTHLVASSISNVHARDSLIASRARIVSAGDETRRRIERDLHDGIQQRLLALGLRFQALRAEYQVDRATQNQLDQVDGELSEILEEIRNYARGLHPPLLARGGLEPAVRSLVRRSPIPVDLTLAVDPRPPQPIEIAVYYVVSETLANAAKHSEASRGLGEHRRRRDNRSGYSQR